MSDEFDNLAQIAANVLVSAMAADSWEAAKRGFAALVGHERQLESTHADLATKRGRDLARAKSEQAQGWVIRLQDILDSNPGMAPALRALIANPGAPQEPVTRSQSQHADHGVGNVNVGGNNAGDIATAGGKINKNKFRFSPLILLGHAAKQAVAHPAVTAITLIVGAGAVSGGLVLTQTKTAPPAASAVPVPTHTGVASAAAHAAKTEPQNLYLYVGNGNLVPQVEPTRIYTADGTIIDEQGTPLPAPYGATGEKYPGWSWSFTPTAASLGWANLNGTTVIQDVIGAGWAPLPAPYTGSYYFKCLEYLPNPLVNSAENWLRWDSASGVWLAMPLADYADYCENQ